MIVYNYDADLEVSDTCARSSLLSCWVESCFFLISQSSLRNQVNCFRYICGMGDSRYRIGLFVFFRGKVKILPHKRIWLPGGWICPERRRGKCISARNRLPTSGKRPPSADSASYERIEHSFISTRSLAVAEEGLGAMPPQRECRGQSPRWE